MKINYITEKESLDKLYNQSALTWEGLSEDKENLQDVEEWLKDNNAVKDDEINFHIIKGNVMNSAYNFTQENRYKSDLTIVSVTGIDISKLITKRFEVGARWFDDIIDNNMSREN